MALLLSAALSLTVAPVAGATQIIKDGDPDWTYKENQKTLAYFDEQFQRWMIPERKEHYLLQLGTPNAYMEAQGPGRGSMIMARIKLEEVKTDGRLRLRATVLERFGGVLPDQFFLFDEPDETGGKAHYPRLAPGECVMQFRAHPKNEADLTQVYIDGSIPGEVLYGAEHRYDLDANGDLWTEEGEWFGSLEELRASTAGQHLTVGDSVYALGETTMTSARLAEDAPITDSYGGIDYAQGKKWDVLTLIGEPYGDKGKERILVLTKTGYGSVAYSALNLPGGREPELLSPYASWREVRKTVSVRSEPGGKGELLGQIQPGFYAMQVGPEKDGYLLVQAGGKSGYAPAADLLPSYGERIDTESNFAAFLGADDGVISTYPDWYGGHYFFGRYYVVNITADTPAERKAELRRSLEERGIEVREVKYSYAELRLEQSGIDIELMGKLGINLSSADPIGNWLMVGAADPSAEKAAEIQARMKHPETLRLVQSDPIQTETAETEYVPEEPTEIKEVKVGG